MNIIKKKQIDLYYKRITKLKYHEEQAKLLSDTIPINHRFTVTPSGRRSGKTEIVGKRRLIHRAVRGVDAPNPRYFVAAPTRDQVRTIYWTDLKLMTLPFQDPKKPPSESRLIIYLLFDHEIHLLGMDKPERVEGSHWDGGVLDEFANMKKQTWLEHVRPALSTPGRPKAWCDFIGVPEGRNHYYDLYTDAVAKMKLEGKNSSWGAYHWFSADILDPEEIEAARSEMDELTFKQEYEGSFINFSGQAYYNFSERHKGKTSYNSRHPIGFCFDFNVAPGVAVIVQEKAKFDINGNQIKGSQKTECIGEVYIPRNSNTIAVCRKLISMFKNHRSKIFIYGDSTGGMKGSAKVLGSDWDLVKKVLTPAFGSQLIWKVPRANPRERQRINAVNSRLRNSTGYIGIIIDPIKCKYLVKDLEGVQLLEGGSGEINKIKSPELTHISDALGYYIVSEFPVINRPDTDTKFSF